MPSCGRFSPKYSEVIIATSNTATLFISIQSITPFSAVTADDITEEEIVDLSVHDNIYKYVLENCDLV